MRQEKRSALEKISGPDMYIKSSAHEEAFRYMCGAAINRYLQQYGECFECANLLCDEAPIRSFVEMRKYDVVCDLKYPSLQCITYLKLVDNILYRNLTCNIHKANLLGTLFKIVKEEVALNLVSCELHKITCEDFILKKWIKMSIKIHCKDFLQNRIKKRRIDRKRKKLLKCDIQSKRNRLL